MNTLIIRHNKEPFKHISHKNFRVYLRLGDGIEHEIPDIVSYEQNIHATGTAPLLGIAIESKSVVIV